MKFKSIVTLLAASWAASAFGQEVLPKPDAAFKGHIGQTRDESVPDWPERAKAPAGAPNIILILLDDVGFAATEVFGGPVKTPALAQLAANGLRYNRFHVNAMCSPTRAALLSGRNSHEMGFGVIAEQAYGYPGYNSIWPKNSVSVAEGLKDNGYSTAAFGKWHNTPMWEVNAAGPFERWPNGLGFEYFYGFMSAQTSQWEPTLFRNTIPVEPPATPRQGYHLTADLVDDAVRWVHQHDALAPQKPFFLYFATGATHVPHHVPAEWIAKYHGAFDEGWDKIRERSFARQKELGVIPINAELTPRPKEIPSWDSLSADQKKLLARQMEVYAGFLAQTDYEVGRLLQSIKADGHNEDTAVFYIVGDNGASAEGGYEGRDSVNIDGKAPAVADRLQHLDDLGGELFMNHYATSWAWALNSPFQWAKEVASHLGGTRDPLVVSWPGHIKAAGGLRSQFTHVNDIAPTLYELAGVKPPESVNGIPQTAFEGTSLVYSFDHPDAPSRHKLQYFEMLGSRGIYSDGWWAGSFNHLPWPTGAAAQGGTPEKNPWELYHLDEDYSQAHNLAAQNPEKLKELVDLFDSEARRNHVYPLEPRREPQPLITTGRSTFVYHAGVQRIPPASAPRLVGRAYTIAADVDLPAGQASGVIVAQGGRYGGFTLYVKDGNLTYETNISGHNTGKLVASTPLPAGKVHIALEFVPDIAKTAQTPTNTPAQARPAPGIAKLWINGAPAGSGSIAGFGASAESLDIGADLGSPVTPSYTSPFVFSGKVDTVTVDLKN
jgi:arylsulfatase A-like enzyme